MGESEEKLKIGRKWFDGRDEDEVIAKFKEIWALDGTDAEAACWANVSTSSLSRYLMDNPSIKEIRDTLRQRPFIKARNTIIKSLEHPEYAFKYMEKKKKREFGNNAMEDLNTKLDETLMILRGNEPNAIKHADISTSSSPVQDTGEQKAV